MSGDNKRYFLTPDDREFLEGNKDITEGSARNSRNRIRTRFKCALEDLELLWKRSTQWRHDQVVQGVIPDDDVDIYQHIVATIGLMYSLTSHSSVSEETIFTEGVRAGAPPHVKNVNVDIEMDKYPEYNYSMIKSKVENGKLPRAWEIGMLVFQGHESRKVEYAGEEKPIIEFIQDFCESDDYDIGEDYVHIF